MTTLHAQPYDITATGLYFKTAAEYDDKSDSLRNEYGQPVEEFEIQFIDGEGIDAAVLPRLFAGSRIERFAIGEAPRRMAFNAW